MNDSLRTPLTLLTLIGAALTSAALVGCGAESPNQATNTPAPAAVPAPSTTTTDSAAAPAAVVVTPVNRAGFDAAIANLHGKVVLVDFWATWCQPCVEQLPHTLELGKKLSDRGLAVVTVSCDEPAEPDHVAKFLTDQHAESAINLISQFGGSPRSMEEFEITSGAVPFYKLYDRKGRLRQTFGVTPLAKKQFTPADIEAAIEQLLAEPE